MSLPVLVPSSASSRRAALADLRRVVRATAGVELHATGRTLADLLRPWGPAPALDDLELTYVCDGATPAEVKAQVLRVCGALIDAGFSGVVEPGRFRIERPVRVTVVPSWIADGRFASSLGGRGAAPEWPNGDDVLRAHHVDGVELLEPPGARTLLDHLHGPGWRDVAPELLRRPPAPPEAAAWLPSAEELLPVFWKHFYANNELPERSTFADFVAERIAPDALVLDIGCGEGRDTTYFATRGFQAVGADASEEGLRRGAARRSGATFLEVDVADASALDALLASPTVRAAQAARREVVVYLRFFLHAIPQEAQDTLLAAIGRHLPAVTLAAEFRTALDAETPKAAAPHFRRYVEPGDVVAQLVDLHGFAVDYRHEGRGLSVYKGEDPHLCRLLARRPVGRPGATR